MKITQNKGIETSGPLKISSIINLLHQLLPKHKTRNNFSESIILYYNRHLFFS